MRTLNGFFAIAGLLILLSAAAAAQVNLTSIDGSRVDVAGQKGKVVVLAVGASWLPLSEKQSDYTNMLVKKYSGRDVVIYFVATDSSLAKSKNFATDGDLKKFAFANHLTIPVLRDPDGASTLKRFNIDQVPSFVILDKNGVAIGEPFGGIDPKYDITVPLSKAIDKLL